MTESKCPHGISLAHYCGNCEQIEIAKLARDRKFADELAKIPQLMGADCRPTADPIAELRRELNAANERIDELTALLWEARGCVVRGSQLDRRIEDALT